METARDILEMILGHLGFVFEVTEESSEDGIVLQIHTRDPGRLIGKDGHTLEELQFLINRLAHADEEGRSRVIVDVEGYRANLREELLQKVRRAAQRVRETGQPLVLDPLNSFDRRIVHNAFKEDAEIMTISPEGPSRFKRITLQLRNGGRRHSGLGEAKASLQG